MFSDITDYPLPLFKRMTRGPLKILHVVISLGPGGMENGIVNVARALPPGEFEVHVCCLETSGAFAARLPQPENVHVLRKPPGFSLRAVRDLHRVIRRVRPHVIHTHNLGPLIYAGLLKNLGCRTPLLHGEHHLLTADECSPRRRRQRNWFYRSCAQVHTVAKSVTAQLLELGFPARKIITLVNGVDSDRFQPADNTAVRRQLGLTAETNFVLGMVGRFIPLKRHTLVIAAFNRLAPANSGLHLLLLGSGGSEENNLRAQAAAGPAAERIHFTGFQNDPLPYYQAMDLLLVASSQEGMSNAVMEAMACGVPVLATPVGGNPELIRHAEDGWLATMDTADQLQTELEHFLREPELLARLGRAARENIIHQFSLDCMMEKYRRLYQTLAGVNPT